MGMPPEMTSKPRKGSASVNRHCRAALRGSVSQENGNQGAEHAPRCSMLWQLMLEIIDGLVDMALIDAASMWHWFQPHVIVIGAFAGPLVGVDIVGNELMMWHGTVVIVSRRK